MIKANVWHLYKEWIRSDDVSPIFIETEDNLRTFNTNELTRNDNIFILFSSVDDGPVMVVSSQRLHDMLNPTKIPIGIPRISTNPDMRCCLLILLRKHFSAPNLMVNMRFSPFLLRVGELIV